MLVTGAAGDIGAAIARAFLEHGAKVHMTDFDAEKLASRVNALASLGNISQSVADLADPSEVTRLAADASRACGRIDILVNNAADQAPGDLGECTPERFDHAYAVNVRAPYLLARDLVPAMRAAGGLADEGRAAGAAGAAGCWPWRARWAARRSATCCLSAKEAGAASASAVASSTGCRSSCAELIVLKT